MMKIKPPKIPTGRAFDGPPEASQITEYLTHCLALDAIMNSSRQRQKSSFNAETGKTKEENESPRRCTQHFLLPCGHFPCSSEAKPGLPVAVAVWWSGSQNLLQYVLQKAAKNKADVEPMPVVLWPNAKEILCSAASRCTRYIALGLDDALVCVWDRLSGAPLPVVLVPVENSAIIRMQFVDCWSVSPGDSKTLAAEKVHLLLQCKSGEIHTVTTGRGTQSCTMQLTERLPEFDVFPPEDNRDLPSVIMPVPFLQGLSLVLQRNGKMFLQDVINKTTVCFLTLPTIHLVTTPCSPVYALNTKQQTLFIRGTPNHHRIFSSAEYG
uniref:WD repeat domain 93 n=1 Tax=Amphiprion ocellaris TaxID=80972 RepID=A0AAQ5YD97_AMPOC